MKDADLPERWKNRIKKFLQEQGREGPDRLGCADFPHNLKLNFPDGSVADFQFSFALTEDEETLVLTEHCGYHIFPSYDLDIQPYGFKN